MKFRICKPKRALNIKPKVNIIDILSLLIIGEEEIQIFIRDHYITHSLIVVNLKNSFLRKKNI